MLAEALELMQRAEHMHRHFFGLSPSAGGAPCWEPPIDMIETDRELAVLIALPGVAPDKVSLVVDGGMLYVVGERLMPAPPGGIIRRLEIPYGRFERRVDLPPGRFDISHHQMTHGCLLVSLRRLRDQDDTP
jgi:HSP20 family molecular chaperone IbpA